MKYETKCRCTFELFSGTDITDEIIYRDLIHRLIKNIPLYELKQIFQLNKLDPSTKESQEIIKSPFPTALKNLLLELKEKQVIEFSAKINPRHF